MTTTRVVTSAIKKLGYPIELVNTRDGYLYFTYDDQDRGIFETESVYVCKFSHLPVDRWIKIGTEFGDRVRQERGL